MKIQMRLQMKNLNVKPRNEILKWKLKQSIRQILVSPFCSTMVLVINDRTIQSSHLCNRPPLLRSLIQCGRSSSAASRSLAQRGPSPNAVSRPGLFMWKRISETYQTYQINVLSSSAFFFDSNFLLLLICSLCLWGYEVQCVDRWSGLTSYGCVLQRSLTFLDVAQCAWAFFHKSNFWKPASQRLPTCWI